MTVFTDVSPAGAYRYWLRNAVVFRRTYLLSMAAWFIEPLLYLLAMGLGLGRYLEQIQGVDYIDFIAPGLMGVAVMWGATFDSTWNAYFKMERGGIYHAATSTPLSFGDIALGEAAWAATRGMLYGLAFAAVCLPLGAFASWWGLAVPLALALTGITFALTGLTFTYFVGEIDYLAYYWTLFLAPMFMFAGIFFPLDRLPDWVKVFAWFMPLHHVAEMLRALMLRGDPADAAASALWLVAFIVVVLPLPPAILRRRFGQ